MDKYKKTSLNGDTLIIDSVRYNVESLNMLPKDLEPRQFAERTNGNLLIVGGIHSSHQPFPTGISVMHATVDILSLMLSKRISGAKQPFPRMLLLLGNCSTVQTHVMPRLWEWQSKV